MTSYRIGVDVGGTFTDVVAVDEDGETAIAKVDSTPALTRPSALWTASTDWRTSSAWIWPALLRTTERIVHGTTVATNALLERKGARVGLLTTEGHRDIIEMREGLKPERYNLRMAPPEPLSAEAAAASGARANAS